MRGGNFGALQIEQMLEFLHLSSENWVICLGELLHTLDAVFPHSALELEPYRNTRAIVAFSGFPQISAAFAEKARPAQAHRQARYACDAGTNP